MNYIFTDIDGVLNTINRTDWNQYSIELYNKVCDEFDLKPIITSTWRIKHSIDQLQQIFLQKGIDVEIYDYTPILNEPRGLEIESYLFKNIDLVDDKWIILDDSVRDIRPYFSDDKIVHCRSWLGLTEEEYLIIKKYFT